MNKPHEPNRLTDYLTEDQPEAELKQLREVHERATAEAQRQIQEASQREKQTEPKLETGKGRDRSPRGSTEPPKMRSESRVDPILPVLASVRQAPAREAGQLAFGGIVEGRELAGAQLPLLPAPEGPRVSLLEIADVRGGPIMARGRGAPLDLRLLVGATILTPHHARPARGRLAVTVRELRDFCFPNGWERRRHWPAIRRALWKARDYVIPDAGGGLWLPFALRRDPGTDASLEDLVLIDVELPPGSAHGPVIDRRELAQIGVASAPRFRAYIAAHSVAWLPGRTRVVMPRSGGRRTWAADADSYPILTAEDRDRLAFGNVDRGRKEGRRKADGYWEDLPGTVILTRDASTPDGHRGWLIVPESAAEAIRKVTAAEGDNRGKKGRQPGEERATTGGRKGDNRGKKTP